MQHRKQKHTHTGFVLPELQMILLMDSLQLHRCLRAAAWVLVVELSHWKHIALRISEHSQQDLAIAGKL